MRFLAALIAGLMMSAMASAAGAQTATGDWTGLLTANVATTFRLAVHIHKSGDAWSGTLDDQSRGLYGLPLTDVAASGDTLSFKLPLKAAPGAFAGKWDAASGHWVGQWTRGAQNPQVFPLTLAPGAWPPEPTVAGLDGVWDGVLQAAPGASLRLVLHVKTGARGTSAWVDSPDQGAGDLDVTALKRDGEAFSFAMPVLKATYAGKVSADSGKLEGTFTQAAVPLPLTFAKRAVGAEAPPGPKRPQEPKPPYPYAASDVTFDGGAPGVKLAGTLTLPEGKGPFPAVVLVSGSGPNARNEEVAGHKIFLVLADYLTRHGVAVLRYDKRGVPKSTGSYATATTADFADDADAAFKYLSALPEIDAAHVGLIGHSEGGAVVPIVAARDPKVAFIVMMAGPGVDGAQILALQGKLIVTASGASETVIADDDALRRKMIDIVVTEKDPTIAKAKLKALVDAFAAGHKIPATALEAGADAINTPWFRYFFTYDPAPTLAKVRCPVLALNGSLDLQVPPAQNLPVIRKALTGNRNATIIEMPGLNHLFQPAKTGSPMEYQAIETTLDPTLLTTITDWVLKETRGPR